MIARLIPSRRLRFVLRFLIRLATLAVCSNLAQLGLMWGWCYCSRYHRRTR
jgi:hypothetical protein